MSVSFGLTVSCQDESMCLRLSGEIDLATAAEVLDSILFAEQHAPRVVLDLTEVTFIDSSGINALVEARRRSSAVGSRLAVRGASAHVEKVMQVAGVDRYLGL